MGGESEPDSLPQQWHSVNMVTHTPIRTPLLAMESTEFEGEREESHVWGLQNDYSFILFSRQFGFFFHFEIQELFSSK